MEISRMKEIQRDILEKLQAGPLDLRTLENLVANDELHIYRMAISLLYNQGKIEYFAERDASILDTIQRIGRQLLMVRLKDSFQPSSNQNK